MTDLVWAHASEIADRVAEGRTTASDVVEATLSQIAAANPEINAFTAVTADRARAEAAALDRAIAGGTRPGALAGVPFAVKNLFDIKDIPTLAGSRINRDRAPATRDALLVERLSDAGAILVGALGMGEYAYDFTGENAHDGAVKNPHDPARMSGGSSSGSGAATAAGMAPISLGSDTNGSLRVPASLCGVFSLKPTYGRLPRTRTFSFVDSLDHLGPLARSALDLALAYDAMQGQDPNDHACARRSAEPVVPSLPNLPGQLRVGIPGGWFMEGVGAQAASAADRVARSISADNNILRPDLDAAEAGRAAAYLITNSESSAFHLERLRSRAADYDPETRDRFLAGALLPAAWVGRAQRVRAWWLKKVLSVFNFVDVLVVPATPISAPRRGEKTLDLAGRSLPLRPTLGLLSQPFSCIGLPVATVPVFQRGELPVGVQIIAPPWREELVLQAAHALELHGVATAHPPRHLSA